MYKIAAVGDFEFTACFGCMGAEGFFAETAEDAEKTVKSILSDEYAVIFVKGYNGIDFSAYENLTLPSVTVIPKR